MNRRFLGFRYLPLLLSTGIACAEDFQLSDGTVFREARVLEVRPDALILSHAKGVAMADLERFPKAVRARYKFDPARATAYRERETATRQAGAEEDARMLAAREAKRLELFRLQMEASEAPATFGNDIGEVSVSYRASASERAYASAISRIGAEIAQSEELRTAAAREPKTFWTADFWQHPILRFVGALMGRMGSTGSGSASEPRGWR